MKTRVLFCKECGRVSILSCDDIAIWCCACCAGRLYPLKLPKTVKRRLIKESKGLTATLTNAV